MYIKQDEDLFSESSFCFWKMKSKFIVVSNKKVDSAFYKVVI